MGTYTEIEVEAYTDNELEDIVDNFLDEKGDIIIAGIRFSPSRILEELDPIAYRCLLSDLQEYETRYECDECGQIHENEFDAECCCEDEEDV